jgi:Domain of unknown function (DUF6602)
MSKPPVIGTILRAHARETVEQLQLATEIEQPGESGRAREQILTAFIRRIIPSSFGVSTGFVVDTAGRKSKQVDVVVYRTDYAPVFDIGGVKHFLVESVAAAIEVKAEIPSWRLLEQALENIRSVKELDRTRGGNNDRLMEDSVIGKVDPNNFYHQIFGAIVTERSMKQNFVPRYRAWLESHFPRVWPNLYVNASHVRDESFIAGYLKEFPAPHGQPRFTANPMAGGPFAKIKMTHHGEPPLLDLAFELVNFFRVVPKIDFSATTYIAPSTPTVDCDLAGEVRCGPAASAGFVVAQVEESGAGVWGEGNGPISSRSPTRRVRYRSPKACAKAR